MEKTARPFYCILRMFWMAHASQGVGQRHSRGYIFQSNDARGSKTGAQTVQGTCSTWRWERQRIPASPSLKIRLSIKCCIALLYIHLSVLAFLKIFKYMLYCFQWFPWNFLQAHLQFSESEHGHLACSWKWQPLFIASIPSAVTTGAKMFSN